MKIKNFIGGVVVLLACNARGTDELEFLEKRFLSVSVTQTNLSFKFKGSSWLISRGNHLYDLSSDYVKRDERFVLTGEKK